MVCSSFLTLFPPGDDSDESGRQIRAESPQSPHEDTKPLKCHRRSFTFIQRERESELETGGERERKEKIVFFFFFYTENESKRFTIIGKFV